MPVSPQHVAPAINEARLLTVYQDIDGRLQSAMEVSQIICEDGHEYYRPDSVTYFITVLAVRLNLSEQEKMTKDYLKAGWKEAYVANEGNEPGKGYYFNVLLRAPIAVAAR